MKAIRKVGLLTVVALVATAAMATSAQAQTINPDDTPVSGTASNVTLTYGVATIVCASATLSGNTGLNSDRIVDLTLEFHDCVMQGVGPVTVSCQGTVTFIAQSAGAPGGTGTIRLNNDFRCDFSTAICTLTITGPATTQDNNTALNESTDVLSGSWDLPATRTGSVACGPASGTANLTVNYAVSPSDLTID